MKKFLVIVSIIIILGVCYGGYLYYDHSILTSEPNPVETYQTMKTQPTIIATNSVYNIMPSGKLGPIFTDLKGKTLYVDKHDSSEVSTCIGGCLKAWPAYVAPSQTGSFPPNISVIKRPDGILQYAWKGMPLYYFAGDKNAGDVNGEGIGAAWYVVKK